MASLFSVRITDYEKSKNTMPSSTGKRGLNSSMDLYNHVIRESKGLIDLKRKSYNIIAYR